MGIQYVVESLGKINTLNAVMVKAGSECWGCVLLPLQSTKEQMHTIKTLHIGRHKQLAMDICIDRICKNIMFLPTNKQAIIHNNNLAM